MPKQNLIYSYSITALGGVVALDVTAPYTKYVIGASSSTTLGAAMSFSPTGTAVEGMEFDIQYNGNVISDVAGGKAVTFFGVALYDGQAAGKCKINAYYDGSAWKVTVSPDLSTTQYNPVLWGYLLQDGSIDTSKIGNGKVTLIKIADLTDRGYIIRSGVGGALEELDASGDGYLLIGDGTDINSVATSGPVTFDSTGLSSIGAGVLVTAMLADNNVTVAKLENSLKYETLTIPVSFEAGEQTTYKLKMSYPGSVVEIYGEAVKAIAGTDDGTITAKNNAGTTMTGGVITFTASDPLTTAYTVTPSANNTFIAGDMLQFLTAKTTAGGKVQLSIKVLRS